jgi:hypothetical protein
MSIPLETVIRPYGDTPSTGFTRPGSKSNQPVRLLIGAEGSYKTLGTHISFSLSLKMGQQHIETAPKNSKGLQTAIAGAAGFGVAGGSTI